MAKILATFKSKSNPKTSYRIKRGKDNVIYCTCWGWLNYGKCWHLTAYKSRKK
jgi:hypothetical protein